MNIPDFTYPKTSWFYQSYATKLGTDPFKYGRWPTMQAALNLYLQREGKVILETGCQRAKDDWGAGCSTQVFSDVIARYGGKLVSVEIKPENIELARQVVAYGANTKFIQGDSITVLPTMDRESRPSISG